MLMGAPSTIRDWYGAAAATLAVALFLWQGTRDRGWLEATAGPFATYFWIGVFAWAVLAFLAIREKQHWWVLATAPFALWPVVAFGILQAACARGNCL